MEFISLFTKGKEKVNVIIFKAFLIKVELIRNVIISWVFFVMGE